VDRVVSVAGARFCAEEDLGVVVEKEMLPLDALRIEDDLDCVPFLPPWACALGDKLWLTNEHARGMSMSMSMSSDDVSGEGGGSFLSTMQHASTKYIPQSVFLQRGHELSWTDSVYTNVRLLETIMNENTVHRIKSHRDKLANFASELKSSASSQDLKSKSGMKEGREPPSISECAKNETIKKR